MSQFADLHTGLLWAVLQTIGKTCIIYCFILSGMKLIGRRSLSGFGPQELILITLMAKVVGDRIVSPEAGLWGNLAAGVTLMLLISLFDRIPWLRRWIEGPPIALYKNGEIYDAVLKQNMLSERDLQRTARNYGRDSIQAFESLILEKDGRITGVLKEEYR
jgi:uncharacterized membrane protein YcaP (DUF421 family)